MSESKIYASDVERIHHEWNDALAAKHIEGLIALYNEDATIESPLIRHLGSNYIFAPFPYFEL